MLTTLRQLAGYLIAGTLLFFLIKPFVQTHAALKNVTFQIPWLIASSLFLLLYRSFYTYPFAILLSRFTAKQVSFRTAFTLFHLANLTRYLPGRIWGVVRLLALSKQFGLSKTAVGGSLTLHVGIETALGGLIALSLLFSKQTHQIVQTVFGSLSGHTGLLTLAVIGILAGVLFCIPKIAKQKRVFLTALRETGTRFFQTSFRYQGVHLIMGHLLLWGCQGLAFFLFVRSLVPVQWTDAGILTGCYAFAWLVGFLSFLTPGGLGVREGLLGLFLATCMPASQATLVALLCRVWMLSAEIGLAGLAFLLNKRAPYLPMLRQSVLMILMKNMIKF